MNAGPRHRFRAWGKIVSNSGRAFQPQNLVRGLGKLQDQAFTALDCDMLEYMYDDLLNTVAGMIRGLITNEAS